MFRSFLLNISSTTTSNVNWFEKCENENEQWFLLNVKFYDSLSHQYIVLAMWHVTCINYCKFYIILIYKILSFFFFKVHVACSTAANHKFESEHKLGFYSPPNLACSIQKPSIFPCMYMISLIKAWYYKDL